MRPDLPERLPLVCPVCRRKSEKGIETYALALERTLHAEDDGDVTEGLLRCSNPSCDRRFPVIDGIPLVVPDLAAYLAHELTGVVAGDLGVELAALLAAAGPDGAPLPRLLEQLAIYLDAHWGDRAEPPPDGPAPWDASGVWPGAALPRAATRPFGLELLAERLRRRQAERVERAIELGASVGRGLAELAQGADLVVGLDWDFAALRRSRRLLRGQPLAYARRVIGRRYLRVEAQAGDLAAENVALLCGDALDPPLLPSSFDRVVALNLIDAVRFPAALLHVVDGLCRGAGEIILTSPFSWQTGTVEEGARLGGERPEEDVAERLERGTELRARYTIEERDDLAWWLRRDSRSGASYSTHYLRARRLG